jgi:hypothetical protein
VAGDRKPIKTKFPTAGVASAIVDGYDGRSRLAGNGQIESQMTDFFRTTARVPNPNQLTQP